jgi:hypothetical protein
MDAQWEAARAANNSTGVLSGSVAVRGAKSAALARFGLPPRNEASPA